jgi:hypothetical protein
MMAKADFELTYHEPWHHSLRLEKRMMNGRCHRIAFYEEA